MAAAGEKVEPPPPPVYDAYVADEAELAARSPARKHGVAWDRCIALAWPCVRIITRACGKEYLNLPDPDQTSYAAVCILQRFWSRVPITALDRCSLAAACLLIACKIEPGMESWRSLDAVAAAAQALRAPPPPPPAADEEDDRATSGAAAQAAAAAAAARAAAEDPAHMAALVAQVAAAERAVLLALNFDVRLPPRGPVRWAREVCRQAKGRAAAEAEAAGERGAHGGGGAVEDAATAILRDAGYTPAPLMAPPEALAKAALWMAAAFVAGHEEDHGAATAAVATGKKGGGAAPPPPPSPPPPGPRFAAYAAVPAGRAEALAAVLERTPAAVRMRAAAAAAAVDGGEGQGKKKKRAREEED